jgi:hypothetical protein
MVFVEGDGYRQLRRPGDDPAQFRSLVRPQRAPPAPDSVAHQYLGSNFTTSTWPDSINNSDITINGPSVGILNNSRAAVSDGVDDIGIAPTGGPETIFSNQQCAVAFTFKAPGTGSSENAFIALRDGNNLLQVFDVDNVGVDGGIDFIVDDSNKNRLFVTSQAKFVDSQVHLVVINIDFQKGASGIDLYIDDMTTTAGTTTQTNGNFVASDFSPNVGLGFFARNTATGRGQDLFKPFTTAFFEFNEQRYSAQERQELNQRAQGL